jgi:hypothetical protein
MTKAMRLNAVAMVRNEADVIEAFVRHTSSFVDALHIIDHRSVDGTRDVLDHLRSEGLPLEIEYDEREGQFQYQNITRLARNAFGTGATIVMPLDADEFLKLPSREALEQWIDTVPSQYCCAVEWQTYVPINASRSVGFANGELAVQFRRAEERHGLHKVLLRRCFFDAPKAVVGPGNHTVLFDGPDQDLVAKPVQLALVPASVLAIAHLPVRSAEQLTRKILNGWAAHQAAGHTDTTLAAHWRDLHGYLQNRAVILPDELLHLAANYGLPRVSWSPISATGLIHDPVSLKSGPAHP